MDETGSRPHEPLVSGVRDGVEHGYRALETVLDGMRGSLDRVSSRSARSSGPDAPRSRRRPATGSHEQPQSGSGSGDERTASGARRPLGELLHVMTDLLSYAGEVAVDVADEFTGGRGHGTSGGALVLRGPATVAGGESRVQFHLHNSQARATEPIDFVATDLIGTSGSIEASAVRFDPGSIDRIPPQGHAEVDIVISVPEKADAGRYRGVVHATLGEAWAVVEVEVVRRR